MLIKPASYQPKETPKPFVRVITSQNFVNEVLDASAEKLILLDFWAPWCEPCRQLEPLLLKIVESNQDKVILAKVNVDENKELAMQLRVQSIPMVMAFAKGQPVDAFMGIVSEQKLTQFIQKLLPLYDDKPKSLEETQKAAEKLFNDSHYLDSAQLYMELLSTTRDEQYTGPLALCFGLMGEKDKMQGFASKLLADNPFTKRITLLSNLVEEPLPRVEVVLPASAALVSALEAVNQHNFEKAIECFLDSLKADKLYSDGLVKNYLIQIFEILGNHHHLTNQGRRKMSSILFL